MVRAKIVRTLKCFIPPLHQTLMALLVVGSDFYTGNAVSTTYIYIYIYIYIYNSSTQLDYVNVSVDHKLFSFIRYPNDGQQDARNVSIWSC